MARTNFKAIVLGAACLLAASQAQGGLFDIVVSGVIQYTDNAAALHPTRGIRVGLYDGTSIISTGSTDLGGAYTLSISNNNPLYFPSLQLVAYADNSAAFVSSTIAAANTYNAPTPNFTAVFGTNTVNFNIPNNGDAQTHAFPVVDALLTGYQYAGAVRGGAAAPAKLPCLFPPSEGTSSFQSATNSIQILMADTYDWDVMDHEYSHYLQKLDNLQINPGGSHTPGLSNIGATQDLGGGKSRVLDKTQGIQLAWGEGLGNYMGVASQLVTPVAFNRPTYNMIGDTYWDDTDDATIRIRLDDNNAAALNGNAGEGDENPVSRVLFSLADGVNGTWDRVNRGHPQVYADLVAAAGKGTISTFNQFNAYYLTKIAANDKDRTDLGAIEMHFDISPTPAGGVIDTFKNIGDPAPVINWSLGNNNANDKFNIIFFNAALTQRLLTLTVPGDEVTTYTLTADQWNFLQNFVGDIKFVVIGSDLKDPTLAAYAAAEQTGNYWSDAFQFTLVPEPSTAMLLILPAGLFLRRRRD